MVSTQITTHEGRSKNGGQGSLEILICGQHISESFGDELGCTIFPISGLIGGIFSDFFGSKHFFTYLSAEKNERKRKCQGENKKKDNNNPELRSG